MKTIVGIVLLLLTVFRGSATAGISACPSATWARGGGNRTNGTDGAYERKGVEQEERWRAAEVKPIVRMRVQKAVFLYRRTVEWYARIERMRNPGAPAPVLFCLHLRESDADFTCHPHEGSPLTHRTRDVPKGRIPAPAEPPFTWEQSAVDAYYVCDRLDKPDWKSLAAALQAMEAFNGTGYARFHPGVPTPYLWSGTTLYSRGKYVKDGRFDPLAVDGQLGCVAVLKAMEAAGIGLPFGGRGFTQKENLELRNSGKGERVSHRDTETQRRGGKGELGSQEGRRGWAMELPGQVRSQMEFGNERKKHGFTQRHGDAEGEEI